MLEQSERESLERARSLMAQGDYSSASQVLSLLLDQECPEALFLASTFSADPLETDADFERRSFLMLERSARGDYVPAMYAVACCYDTGDLVAEDRVRAAQWFRSAAAAGHVDAIYRYGLAVFHGEGGDVDESPGMGGP